MYIKFNCKRKKTGKTIVGKSAIRGDEGVQRLTGEFMFFFSFFGTLPIVRICTLLLVKNTSKHFMLKNLWILILHLIDTSKHVMN